MTGQIKTCRFYFLCFFLILVSIAAKASAATDSDDFEERLEKDVRRYEKMSKQELVAKIIKRGKELIEYTNGAGDESYDRVSRLTHLAILQAKAGFREDSRENLDEARQIFKDCTQNQFDPFNEQRLASLAAANAQAGFFDEALHLLRQVKGVLEKNRTLATLATEARKTGQTEAAQKILHEMKQISGTADDWSLESISSALAEAGRFSEAVQTARTIGDWYAQEGCVRTIARLQRKAGLESDADQTLEILVHPVARVNALTDIASEKTEAKDYATAEKYLDEAVLIAETVEDGYWRCDVFRNIGYWYARIGAVDQARKAYEKSIEIAIKPDGYLQSNWADGFSEEEKKKFDFRDRQSSLGNIAASQSWAGLHADALQTAKLIQPGEERDSAYDRIASGYAYNGKDKEAMELIDTVATRWRRQTGLQDIAEVQIKQGRFEQALVTIRHMQEDDDKDYGYTTGMSTIAEMSLKGECQSKLAEAHATAGRLALAIALADRIVDPRRCLEAYVLIVGSIRTIDDESSNTEPEKVFEKAKRLADHGRQVSRIRYYRPPQWKRCHCL